MYINVYVIRGEGSRCLVNKRVVAVVWGQVVHLLASSLQAHVATQRSIAASTEFDVLKRRRQELVAIWACSGYE
jgi:hypothetical protein